MISPIIGRPISLNLCQAEEMLPPQRGSRTKQAATKISSPKNKKNKQDDTVPVRSKIARRQRKADPENRANLYAESMGNNLRDISEER